MKTAMRIPTFVAGLLCFAAAGWAQDWPQWRGPNRDNKIIGFSAPKSWPEELKKKWRVTVGVGEASPALVGSKLFVFARQGESEVIHCLNADSGKSIWKYDYLTSPATGAAGGFPGPRSTLAVAEGKVCTLGVRGMVCCLDAETGKLLWKKDTKEYPSFFTSTSPIIADGKCIVYLKALTAFNLTDGSVAWKWSDGGTPYGSPVLMTVDGGQQVVTPYNGGLAGIALKDGKLLWKANVGGGGYTAHFSTPLVDGQTVYFSAGVKGGKGGKGGAGGAAFNSFKIEKKDGEFTAKQLWKKDFAAAGYHAPLYRDGLIYGVSSNRTFFCIDASTGAELWKDTTKRGECGSILDAGAVLLSLNSDSNLVVFQPGNKGYKELAKYAVSDSPTWSVPIVAGNRIYVKDKGGSLTLWTID